MIGFVVFLFLAFSPLYAASPNPDVVPAGAALEEAPLEDAPSEALADERIGRLTKALRCPVCQGLSVSDSPSDAARAMGDRIAELVRLGYTEEQITDYFVDRYGPWVELEPPAEGRHVLLFLAPGVIVFLGLVIAGVAWRRRAIQVVSQPSTYEPDPELVEYRAQILAELEGAAS